MSKALELMDSMGDTYTIGDAPVWQALRDEVERLEARVARLERAAKSGMRDLRRAVMSGPDHGHYPAFHELCEALNESPTPPSTE